MMRGSKLHWVGDAEPTGPIIVPIDGQLGERIRLLAAQSGTSAASWAREALDMFVREYRSNRPRLDPTRHWDRNGDDADHVVTE